jgi:TolB-like protein
MRGDDDHHSRKVRFYPFELDLSTGELSKYRLRIRLQRQPLQILNALLAKPGETVTREELRELIWPGNVFLDYEHGLNRSMNKLRCALSDNALRPRYIETVHGRGHRFIAPVENGTSAREARLAVLPVENVTGLPENDELADGITEAMIDGLGRAEKRRLRVIALASVLRYKNRRIRMAKAAAELRADYLVCGRLRSEDGRFRLRVELVDARDRTSRWTESFLIGCGSLGPLQRDICNHISGTIGSELLPSHEIAHRPDSAAEALQAI